MVNTGSGFVLSAAVVAIIVASVVAGVYLSSPALVSSTSKNESMGRASTSTTASLEQSSTENSSSVTEYSTTSSFFSTFYSSNFSTSRNNSTTTANSTGPLTTEQGSGGPGWFAQENITAEGSNKSMTIYCGGWGTGAMDETLCNEEAKSNANDTFPAAYFGLTIAGGGSSWQFNLGVTHGQGQANYTWQFGDGTSGTSVSNQTISHAYNSSGYYEVNTQFLISSPNASTWTVSVSMAIYVQVGSPPTQQNSTITTTDGSTVCPALFDGVVGTGGWNSTTDTCTLSGNPLYGPTFLMDRGYILTIAQNVTLKLRSPGSGFANYGIIVNNGTLILQGLMTNYGILINHGKLVNYNINFDVLSAQINGDPGVVNNTGVIENEAGAGISNGGIINNNGTIDNAGTIQNTYVINNYGSIVNICEGVLSGKQVSDNPATTNVAC